jgi:hypothetical protein
MTGSKADGVNFTETKPLAPEMVRGGEPVSIRKRGYHRALKSGKQWALTRKYFQDISRKLAEDFYDPMINTYILTGNPLLKLSGLSGWLSDPKKSIPIQYFGLDRDSVPFRFTPEFKPYQSLWSRIKSWFSL